MDHIHYPVDDMKNQLLIEVHKQPQTVFTIKEIALFMPELSAAKLRGRVAYSVQVGAVKRMARGVYAKENYDPLELANKLYVPSYVSLETVLRQAGITFQHYDQIFSVSYLTRTLKIDNHVFEYHKMAKNMLLDKRGLVEKGSALLASPERAFLDAVYFYKEYHFDNLGGLDWEKVFALQGLYENKALEKRVKEYQQIFKEGNVG